MSHAGLGRRYKSHRIQHVLNSEEAIAKRKDAKCGKLCLSAGGLKRHATGLNAVAPVSSFS